MRAGRNIVSLRNHGDSDIARAMLTYFKPKSQLQEPEVIAPQRTPEESAVLDEIDKERKQRAADELVEIRARDQLTVC